MKQIYQLGPSCSKVGEHYLKDKLDKEYCSIHWIAIYPIHSVIWPLNNKGQEMLGVPKGL